MKKYLKIPAILCLTALLAVSCGKKGSDSDSDSVAGKDAPKEGVIKAETTTVSGDLGECYKVVDREYKPTGEHPALLTVELERTEAELPFDTNAYHLLPFGGYRTDGGAYANVGFGIEMLDADGNVIDKVSANGAGVSGAYSSDDNIELVKLTPGSKGSIRFQMPFKEEDAAKVVKFRITSAYQLNGDPSASMDESEDLSGGSLSGSNWDAVLDEYESYMNQIRAINQRIMNGDTSAASEIASIMSKAQSLEEKLDNARGDMTEAQIQRLQRIITSAVQ